MNINFLVAQTLKSLQLKIAVAESCTGGLISKLLTDVPGSSDFFHCGIVSYSNESKMSLLDVDNNIISKHGAVSKECAVAMVTGLYKKTNCDICIATTGIAGPTGGSILKPVGLVYTSFLINKVLTVKKIFLKGSRDLIRQQTANFCLKFLLTAVNNNG